MTAAAIPALEQEVRFATELIATLTPAEWERASGCAGWRVQDVVQHMASVFQQIADPASIDIKAWSAREREGVLVSGVAHELNNPLQAILGFAELLQMHAGMPDQARADLTLIQKESTRASARSSSNSSRAGIEVSTSVRSASSSGPAAAAPGPGTTAP